MTAMNWLWLVIGIVLGGVGQRWLGHSQRQRDDGPVETSRVEPAPADTSLTEPLAEPRSPLSRPESADAEWLWLSYVRALERAQFQGGFLARTAHELRSPLSSLMGLQQLILADLCDDAEEERQCVAQSYEAAQNLHSLMDQLIRVSKLEQGSQRLDIQPIAIDALLEEVESFVQLQAADRNCRLHLQLPAQSTYALADYNSLRQALVMLIEAALSQNAAELSLELSLGDSSPVDSNPGNLIPGDSGAVEQGILLRIKADRALFPLQEIEQQLQTGPIKPLEPSSLNRLKQSLAQDPERKRFVPHRLSPGMVLFVGQLLVDLNGGQLKLAAPDKAAESVLLDGASSEEKGAGEKVTGERGVGAIAAESVSAKEQDDCSELGCMLELWLPAAVS